MKELIFLIEDDTVGGLSTKVLGEDILTEAENSDELKENINDAVKCILIRMKCQVLLDFIVFG